MNTLKLVFTITQPNGDEVSYQSVIESDKSNWDVLDKDIQTELDALASHLSDNDEVMSFTYCAEKYM